MEKYQKLKNIGHGGFGTAYLVKERRTGQQFVIKVVNLQGNSAVDQNKAKKEAILLRQLRHPSIVKYIDAFVETGSLNIVMEYCDGGDLAGIINQQALSEQQIWDFFVQMCLAVKYLHEHNILHRDIKPPNVFLTRKCLVKLGDFGIAKELSHANGMAQTQIGTLTHMSPEIWAGLPYGMKSDVWGLGCVLYEMATRKMPFRSSNIGILMHKITNEKHAPLEAGYSRDMTVIINSLLHKSSRMRSDVPRLLQQPCLIDAAKRIARQHESYGKLMCDEQLQAHQPPQRNGKLAQHGACGGPNPNGFNQDRAYFSVFPIQMPKEACKPILLCQPGQRVCAYPAWEPPMKIIEPNDKAVDAMARKMDGCGLDATSPPVQRIRQRDRLLPAAGEEKHNNPFQKLLKELNFDEAVMAYKNDVGRPPAASPPVQRHRDRPLPCASASTDRKKDDSASYSNMASLFGTPDSNEIQKDLSLYDELLAHALQERELEMQNRRKN